MHQPKQLQLFEILIQPEIKAIYDPYWDEITSDVGEQLHSEDSQYKSFGEQVILDTSKVAHQHNAKIYPPHTSGDSQYKSVGEQVIPDTLKVAHQHDAQLYLPHTEEIFTHWVEEYWVERGTNKYWYYRYTWMEGRKLHRHYIGSITSNKAKAKKQAVKDAILDGQSPQEIKQLIRDFKVCPYVPFFHHYPKLS
jgi:hypothetical protein